MEDPKKQPLRPKRLYRSNSFVVCLDEFSEIRPKSPKNNIRILAKPSKTRRTRTLKSPTPFLVSERETISSKNKKYRKDNERVRVLSEYRHIVSETPKQHLSQGLVDFQSKLRLTPAHQAELIQKEKHWNPQPKQYRKSLPKFYTSGAGNTPMRPNMNPLSSQTVMEQDYACDGYSGFPCYNLKDLQEKNTNSYMHLVKSSWSTLLWQTSLRT